MLFWFIFTIFIAFQFSSITEALVHWHFSFNIGNFLELFSIFPWWFGSWYGEYIHDFVLKNCCSFILFCCVSQVLHHWIFSAGTAFNLGHSPPGMDNIFTIFVSIVKLLFIYLALLRFTVLLVADFLHFCELFLLSKHWVKYIAIDISGAFNCSSEFKVSGCCVL